MYYSISQQQTATNMPPQSLIQSTKTVSIFSVVLIQLHVKVYSMCLYAYVLCLHTPCPGLRTGFLLFCYDLQILHNIHTKVSNIH